MGLFKLPGHYVFDYKPIFYDPKKEEREKRLERIKKELGVEDDIKLNSKPKINFRSSSIQRRRKERTSTVRFLVILVLLMIMVYLFLFTSVLDKLLEKII